MGGFSIWHWIIVGAVILLLFGGRGKISEMMGDMAKGIKAFKTGMREEGEEQATPPATQPAQPAPAAQSTAQPQPAPQPAAAQQPRAHAQ